MRYSQTPMKARLPNVDATTNGLPISSNSWMRMATSALRIAPRSTMKTSSLIDYQLTRPSFNIC